MQQVNLPKISVIIPVLNAEKCVEKAIRSVLDQAYKNIELIILDAGSTDGTIEIIKRYESYINYWHSKPDGSAYQAINLGITHSTGDLIAQLMADDWFEPDIFHAIAKTFIKNPSADLISCGGRIVCFDEVTQHYKTISVYTDKQQIELNFQNICFGIPAMSTRFFTRTLIKKVGLIIPFDEQGKHIFSGDREFLLRVAINQSKNVVIEQVGHTYLAHSGSATFGKNRQIALRIFQEHMNIATTYLNKPELTQQQRKVLKRWYNDQSVRFLLFKVIAGDFNAAWSTGINGLREANLAWLVVLISVFFKAVIRKIL